MSINASTNFFTMTPSACDGHLIRELGVANLTELAVLADLADRAP
jgi:hypothetical protein